MLVTIVNWEYNIDLCEGCIVDFYDKSNAMANEPLTINQ